MPLWGMAIDLDRCTACQACVLACKSENNVPYVEPGEAARGRILSWMDMVTEVAGPYPRVHARYIPRPCLHCDEPPCTKVCPVHATYRDPEGIVAQNYARCIGCRFCMAACPYTAKYFNWHLYTNREDLRTHRNPDVALRPKGVVEKCTFCVHRLQKARDRVRAEGRELEEGDFIPACAQTCPAGAITFGDLEDPDSAVSRLHKSSRAFRLLEELGTRPKVVYLIEGEKDELL